MRKPGDCLIHAQGEKTSKGLPRTIHCTDRAQTPSTVTPRSQWCPPPLTFRIKVRARRDMSEKSAKNDDCTYTDMAPVGVVGCSPRGDARWHAVGRHGMKREVVHREGRGLRLSDDICQKSKTEVERPSDRASVAERPGVGSRPTGRFLWRSDQALPPVWA